MPEHTPAVPRRSLFVPWRWPRWVLIPLILLLLLGYVLSIGPVICLVESGTMPEVVVTIAHTLYLPLLTACEYSPPLKHLLNAYLDWWS